MTTAAERTTNKTFRIGHIPPIDGLRAFSIIFVLGYHSMGGPILGSFTKDGGWIGVDAFFVISGFLITSLLLKELHESGRINFPNFWLRRFFRLFPALIFYLVARLLINPRNIDDGHNLRAFLMSLFSLSDCDLAFAWNNVNSTGFEPTWSLSVEEKFYLIWPFVLAFLGFRAPIFCVAGIVLSQVWKAVLLSNQVVWMRMCPAPDTHIDSLLLGCLVAHLLNNEKVRNWIAARGNLFALALGLLTFSFVLLTNHPGSCGTRGQMVIWLVKLPLFSACVAMLIACVAVKQDLWVAKFLSWKPIQWVGLLSYSLYLWDRFFSRQVHEICQRYALGPYVEELLNIALAFACASLSYYLIERSFLKFRDKFRFKRDSSATEQAAVPDQSPKFPALRR